MQAQADLPKKNAAPAEAPKSLGATIQNVITKAVTSPTDGKIDFAQGVNHITGDPHQKSAGPADAMQSLKAMNDPEKTTYSNANEAEEKKDKEKEDMKEVADKDNKKMEMMKAEVEKMKKELHDKEKMMKAEKE